MNSRRPSDPAGAVKGEKNLGALSKQYSARDLPSHTKLKYRKQGQGNVDDVKNRDFKRELSEREKSLQASHGRDSRKASQPSLPSSSGRLALPSSSSSTKKRKLDANFNPDADDERLLATADSDDSDSSDDDQDDTAELLAELNRIKQERAAEEARKEAERKEQDEKIRMENILKGNPLLNSSKTDFKVKRRWDDDVVFKNCARNDSDNSKTFINDTLRSEFHKKFMEKYIK
ncbi:spliceosome-associated protein CWC15 [Brevipalpus obovatus]|uniref:spliceosome-associated protein CWC15 n=1 Tax=Brevipalpus obovatus TaxID=246614 RepID=UPI003D9ECC41